MYGQVKETHRGLFLLAIKIITLNYAAPTAELQQHPCLDFSFRYLADWNE